AAVEPINLEADPAVDRVPMRLHARDESAEARARICRIAVDQRGEGLETCRAGSRETRQHRRERFIFGTRVTRKALDLEMQIAAARSPERGRRGGFQRECEVDQA